MIMWGSWVVRHVVRESMVWAAMLGLVEKYIVIRLVTAGWLDMVCRNMVNWS